MTSFDVKVIIIACGTASSAALPDIKNEFDIPIIGVVDAASYAAVHATKNKKIGIIGTQGTIKSGSYEQKISNYDPDIKTFAKACPLFVPLVENGHFDTPVTELVVEEYLADIKAAGVDTLILGCTHYPLIKEAIGRYMGEEVTLINSGAEVARYLKKCLDRADAHNTESSPEQYRYYVSDSIESFEELGGIFLERKINGQVRKIDIEKY